MKTYSKFLLLVLIVAGFVGPMLITGPNGRPLMTLGDWLPDVGKLGEPGQELIGLADSAPAQFSANSGKMYKWQDAQGRWHFSSEKPVEQVQATIEQLPEVENVMVAPSGQAAGSSTIALPGLSLEQAGELLQKATGKLKPSE